MACRVRIAFRLYVLLYSHGILTFIKELHHGLTRRQGFAEGVDQFGTSVKLELLRGAWKALPNNPTRPDGTVHEYCPPEFVQDEIDQLLTWHANHVDRDVCPEVEAAWLHHAFTQIHPFQDGNGRVARALSAGIFVKADYLTLVIRDAEHKERYLAALEAADRGDLAPLVDLFAEIQIHDLGGAIEYVRSLRGEPIIELASSAAERAKLRKEKEEQYSQQITRSLMEMVSACLQEVAAELDRQFSKTRVRLDARVFQSEAETETYWTKQIVEAAQQHRYWADLSRPRIWIRLRLGLPDIEEAQTSIVFSFHAVQRAADLRTVVAFMSTSSPRAEEEGPDWEFRLLTKHPFRYRAKDFREGDLKDRFRNWFEDAITEALDVWQSRI